MTLPEPPGDQLRIGVAIGVPAPYGPVLRTVRERVGDPAAALIPPHVTLLGPTVVEPEECADVRKHLATVASRYRPFVLRLAGAGTFRPVSPVVFAEVIEGAVECRRLAEEVRTGPLAQDLRFDYHPHVTVAHGVDEADLDRAEGELAAFEASFVVHRIEASVHGHDGRWRPVRAFALSDRAAGARGADPA